jgi:hypothetical protein
VTFSAGNSDMSEAESCFKCCIPDKKSKHCKPHFTIQISILHKNSEILNKNSSTNYMELSPSWEATSWNPQHFMETKVSLSCSQEPATGPYPEPDNCSRHPHILSFHLI